MERRLLACYQDTADVTPKQTSGRYEPLQRMMIIIATYCLMPILRVLRRNVLLNINCIFSHARIIQYGVEAIGSYYVDG